MIKINTPVSEEEIRKLKIGDEVSITGTIVTARDRAHKYMVEEKPDDVRAILENSIIYHCGPVMNKDKDGIYHAVAAGPTTSIREEPYQSDVIKEYKVRAVIGKGGMGKKTLDGLKKHGAVYLHAIGGASQVLASRIIRTVSVIKLEEFGTPEAFWQFEVKDFPAIVTMDSYAASLHETVEEISTANMKKILEAL